MPLQGDIILVVQGAKYISVVDCSGQFHQFLVKPEDRHKFTVVSHRGAEQFNVAAMAYGQRQMDKILRPIGILQDAMSMI